MDFWMRSVNNSFDMPPMLVSNDFVFVDAIQWCTSF